MNAITTIKPPTPVIKPTDIEHTRRQNTIRGLSTGHITHRLGFPPNKDEGEGPVESSWEFTVDGVECAVWDYCGSQNLKLFSAFGPRDALVAVFGAEHVCH